jgi:hypothetical protein
LPDVVPGATPVAAEGQPEGSGISKRQQKINDYERTIATLNERVKALEGGRAPVPAAAPHEPTRAGERTASAAPVEPAPAETTQKAYERYMAMPGAPKMDDFPSVEAHTYAVHAFIAEKRDEEHAAQETERGQELARRERVQERFSAFQARLHAAREADPKFVEKLSEEARNLHGFQRAKELGLPDSPRFFIGELAYDSPMVAEFLQHISEHPEALKALEEIPASVAAIRDPRQRAAAHCQYIEREFYKLEGRLEDVKRARGQEDEAASAVDPRRRETGRPSTISAAPPPPQTLGRAGRSGDPSATAVARNDFRAFHEAETAKQQRRRRGVSG